MAEIQSVICTSSCRSEAYRFHGHTCQYPAARGAFLRVKEDRGRDREIEHNEGRGSADDSKATCTAQRGGSWARAFDQKVEAVYQAIAYGKS